MEIKIKMLFKMTSLGIACGLMIGLSNPAVSGQSQALSEMRGAASAWLDSLSPALREQATFTLDDSERKAWSNLPAAMFKREGVSFGQMSDSQRVLAHRLLRSALSAQGYLKASGIMRLDEILKGINASERLQFGQDNYWIGIFGNPDKDDAWGWQLDGHHLALNFTVVGDQLSVTPAFLGSDPAEVLKGADAGWYVLKDEDKLGRDFWASLDADQRAVALLDGETPKDVITGPGRADQAPEISGLSWTKMNAQQREKFMRLLVVYVDNLTPELAMDQERRIMDAGVDKLHFAWSGVEQGKPYYYRIHGPTVLIEFENSYPPGQGEGKINHIHSVWRDAERDYGEDLLKQHHETSPHHQ
jgi:hypothetical protein